MNGIDEADQGTGGRKLKVVRPERYRCPGRYTTSVWPSSWEG